MSVEIGPGTFTGQFSCTGSGFVSLRGAGVKNTIIQNGSAPISSSQCVNLVFSDFTVKNTQTLFGVHNLGGTTTWNNIEIIGLGYAWFDTPGGQCGAPGAHYWFNSRIVAEKSAAGSTTAYFNACDESWFFGSEITAKGDSGAASTPIRAVGGEVHVYGSVIRALPQPGANNYEVTAVTAVNSAKIHIHGTGIDVISTQGNNITALKAANGGHIHANETSYVLQTGAGGTVTRLDDGNGTGSISAPFMWKNSASAPSINSITGADVYVSTSTNDGHPHMMIYDNNCANKWFDSTVSSCL